MYVQFWLEFNFWYTTLWWGGGKQMSQKMTAVTYKLQY